MSIDDMSTPAGWSIRTQPGWAIMGSNPDRVPRVSISRGIVPIPQSFEMTVKDEEESISLMLLFFVIDKEPRMNGAMNLTTATDLDQAMAEVWKLRPKEWWTRKALYSFTINAEEEKLGEERGVHYDEMTEDQRAGDSDGAQRIYEALQAVSQVPLTRRRDRVTDTLLEEVATVYRAAIDQNGNPTQAVADHFFKSHSTAARWVMRARKAGHLGPANGRKAGEIASPKAGE